MKKYLISFMLVLAGVSVLGQPSNDGIANLAGEVTRLKDIIKEMQENDLQSEKTKYLRNYQLVLYGIEIIKEIRQGTIEISSARNQNILYKKIIDINNPSSDALGFQLMDVIDKTLEESLNVLPLLGNDRRRLRDRVSGFVEGIKRTFPPLQIISSAVSMISSFTSYKTRIERLSRRADSLIVEATYPITKEIITKINMHMAPYIDFYNLLNKTNNTYENALYTHEIEYKDFIEEVKNLQTILEGAVDINESIGEQINVVFDLANSSRQDFDFRKINENEKIRNLAGNCLSIYNLVERYKKFTSDFIAIQDGFYSNYIVVLEQVAQKLPIKDEGKIGKLIADLNIIKKGNPSENVSGFEDAYRVKLKSITTKLVALNRTRF